MRGCPSLCSLVLLASLSLPVLGQGQEAPAGDKSTNVYMTGTEVRPTGPIHGDLVAAAGRISVDYAINGDAVLAAGSIDVRGRVGEDLRIAGGFVTLTGRVRGEALVVAASLGFGPDAEVGTHLSLMLACMREDRASVPWKQALAAAPYIALGAARSLAVGGAFPVCAEDGFRAVLADQGAASYHWGAFLGLQGVLAAQGRTTELRTLIDSLTANGVEALAQFRLSFSTVL